MTAGAEYAAASDCARETTWVRKLVADLLKLETIPATRVFRDNSAAAKLCYNPLSHAKQKHIDIAYHFIHEQVTEFITSTIMPVPTMDQLADIGMKVLPAPHFEYLIRKMRNIPPDCSLRTVLTTTTETPALDPTVPACQSEALLGFCRPGIKNAR